MTNALSSSFEGLGRVSSKREEWIGLSLEEKLELLNELTELFRDGYEQLYTDAGLAGLKMMGIPADTDEGEMMAEELVLLLVTLYKSHLYATQQVYKARVEKTLPAKYKTRTAINGQVCVQVYPTVPVSKASLTAGFPGEIWLDRTMVPSEDHVQPYQFVDDETNNNNNSNNKNKKSGLMLVLGAGNQSGLALCDVLYGLFQRNCVCYLKLHQLRHYTEPLIRKLFQPLIQRGYVEVECHTTNERAAALVHHPLVTAVHLTGGKATHDAIVWGDRHEQQDKNRQSNTPVLQAEMTSELGAVSPWIVVPAHYTTAELKDQAAMLAAMMHSNASCNCNAPKMIVVSDSWDQKDDFLNIIETTLKQNLLPVPYYPGCAQRWQTFRDQYPQAVCLDSTTGMGVNERKLSPPLYNKTKNDNAILLPFLVIDLLVDLTTEQGRASVKKEYAVNNEPFCPVYTVARLQHTETVESFCETAATFCNDYVFGSLSGTVTMKPELLLNSACGQQLIANLRYGSIGVNVWGGFCYTCAEGGWGAFPGESLAHVESGMGRIANVLAFAGLEKFVVTSPLVSRVHPKLEKNLKKQTRILRAVNKLSIAPGVRPVLELVSAITGIDWVMASLMGGATVVAVAGYLLARSSSSNGGGMHHEHK